VSAAIRLSSRPISTRVPRPAGLRGVALGVLVALGLAACGGGTIQQGPSDALRAYAKALEEGRADDAYRLLSDEARRAMSLEAFRRAVKDNPDEALEVAKALARPSSDPTVLATVTVPSGEELVMVYEDGRWRIDAAAVDLYGQSTPRQALLGFLRAYEKKRWDVVLRYVPEADLEGVAPTGEDAEGGEAPKPSLDARLTVDKLKASWEGPQKEQMDRVVQAIKAALPTATIEEIGDSAAMAYGAGARSPSCARRAPGS
jgi:hypothetical protein